MRLIGDDRVLGRPGPLVFRERFTAETSLPPEPDAAALMELTDVNESDPVTGNPAWGRRIVPGLPDLLRRARARLSEQAGESWAILALTPSDEPYGPVASRPWSTGIRCPRAATS